MEILINNLNKSYKEKKVLDNISAVFSDKQINYIMGESGGGKTTLLNIIMGIEKSDSGEIVGIENKKISTVFQEDRLCENFNAIANIRLVCNMDNDIIIGELEKVGLGGDLDKPIKFLSGGMKRRVAIVRAMLFDSDILIMDEPLKGLDEETKNNVVEYIKTRINNRLVIMVTHEIDETLYIKGTTLKM